MQKREEKKKKKPKQTQAFGVMLIASYVNMKFPLTKEENRREDGCVCVCVRELACLCFGFGF